MDNKIEIFLSNEYLNKRIFFPRTYTLKDYYEVECGDETLYCSYFPAGDSENTLIFFHGNGETARDHFYPLPSILESIDCNLLLFEYRGYGMSTGIPKLPLIRKDVKTVIESLGIDEEKIILFGRSIGAFPAVFGIKFFPKIPGIIIDSGWSYPIDFINKRFPIAKDDPLSSLIIDWFDIEGTCTSFAGKALILHTVHDNLVPYENAVQYEEYFNDVELISFKSGSHNTIISKNFNEYFGSVEDFVDDIFP